MKSLTRRTLSVMAGLLFVLSVLLAPQSASAQWGRYPGPYTDAATVIWQSSSMLDNPYWGAGYIRTKYYGQRVGVRRDPNGGYGTYIRTNGFWTMFDYQYGGWGFIWADSTTVPYPGS